LLLQEHCTFFLGMLGCGSSERGPSAADGGSSNPNGGTSPVTSSGAGAAATAGSPAAGSNDASIGNAGGPASAGNRKKRDVRTMFRKKKTKEEKGKWGK